LFDGNKVSVVVGGKEFRLPEALLCYYSTYFKAALRGGLEEAKEGTITLSSDNSIETFELIVKWIYTGGCMVDFPQLPALAEMTKAQHNVEVSKLLTRYIEFLKLADEIDLFDSFEAIFEKVKDALWSRSCDHQPLLGSHIRSIFQLPRGHRLRKLIINVVIGDYIQDIMSPSFGQTNSEKHFMFGDEVHEIENFASDLLQIFQKLMGTKIWDRNNGSYYRRIQEPNHYRKITFLR
jgi:hypothetical protein